MFSPVVLLHSCRVTPPQALVLRLVPAPRAAPPGSGTRPGSGPADGRGRRRSSGRARTRRAPRDPPARHRMRRRPRCRGPATRVPGAAGRPRPRRWDARGLAGHGVERRVADVDPDHRTQHPRGLGVVGWLPRRGAPGDQAAHPADVVRARSRPDLPGAPPPGPPPRAGRQGVAEILAAGEGDPPLEDRLGRERVGRVVVGARPRSRGLPDGAGLGATRPREHAARRSRRCRPGRRPHAAPPPPGPTSTASSL